MKSNIKELLNTKYRSISKKLIFTSAMVLFICFTTFAQVGGFFSSSSQDLRYEVRATHKRPVKKETLNQAKLISDFIPGYPANWITEYVAVEVLATCNGKAMKAMSKNEVMNAEQKNILNTVDLTSNIIIYIWYKYKNPITNNLESNKMNISVSIVPEKEAEYVGGYEQMIKYLKENSKTSAAIPKQFQQAAVIFTVNEEGEITNAKISRGSGDPIRDKLLLEAINKMPTWNPAENSKGIKVKQEFEFSVEKKGGC